MEVEVSYILDLPQLLTVMNSDDLQWQKGRVNFEDNGIWFKTDNGWEPIPLQAIGIIGRDLPESFISKARSATGQPSEFAVDYSKKTTFGSTYLISTIVFAGSAEDILKIKTFLEQKLGYPPSNNDPLMKEGYLQLVSLIAGGITDQKYLLSIFRGNVTSLNEALVDLRSLGMLGEDNLLTEEGIKNFNNFKDIGAVQEEINSSLEEETEEKDEEIDSEALSSFNGDAVGITLNYGKTIIKSVIHEDELTALLPSGKIESLDLRNEGILILDVFTASGLQMEIFARKEIILSLYLALSRKMDIYDRILALSFAKISDFSMFSGMLEREQKNVRSCISKLQHFGYLGMDGRIEARGLDRLSGQFANIPVLENDFSDIDLTSHDTIEDENEIRLVFERLVNNGHIKKKVEDQFPGITISEYDFDSLESPESKNHDDNDKWLIFKQLKEQGRIRHDIKEQFANAQIPAGIHSAKYGIFNDEAERQAMFSKLLNNGYVERNGRVEPKGFNKLREKFTNLKVPEDVGKYSETSDFTPAEDESEKKRMLDQIGGLK
ncbi:hypothetical protein J2755_000508 [Methanohalophilus levihalophilus]|uniref:hypothetical protein n=1 Tax=Methanohalophilus levihalophilus TaxID=1431282 RepID=UPI001AE9C6BD|nr:hypothetical protein [Methanohalophilus levihalophilus]MBP2029588.1 hypothetical protein [Methanohalophilus levihalophilus]